MLPSVKTTDKTKPYGNSKVGKSIGSQVVIKVEKTLPLVINLTDSPIRPKSTLKVCIPFCDVSNTSINSKSSVFIDMTVFPTKIHRHLPPTLFKNASALKPCNGKDRSCVHQVHISWTRLYMKSHYGERVIRNPKRVWVHLKSSLVVRASPICFYC